jgi:hypothetical protein
MLLKLRRKRLRRLHRAGVEAIQNRCKLLIRQAIYQTDTAAPAMAGLAADVHLYSAENYGRSLPC